MKQVDSLVLRVDTPLKSQVCSVNYLEVFSSVTVRPSSSPNRAIHAFIPPVRTLASLDLIPASSSASWYQDAPLAPRDVMLHDWQ